MPFSDQPLCGLITALNESPYQREQNARLELNVLFRIFAQLMECFDEFTDERSFPLPIDSTQAGFYALDAGYGLLIVSGCLVHPFFHGRVPIAGPARHLNGSTHMAKHRKEMLFLLEEMTSQRVCQGQEVSQQPVQDMNGHLPFTSHLIDEPLQRRQRCSEWIMVRLQDVGHHIAPALRRFSPNSLL
jgi:hypothetical protein